MWLIFDSKYRSFKTRELTAEIKIKVQRGDLTVIDLITMESMNVDGSWSTVQDWQTNFERDLKECDHVTTVMSKCDACDVDEQTIVDENKVAIITEGYYHLHTPSEDSPTLAKLYINPDAQCEGFGFNIADGGGFIAADDVSEKTRIVPVTITEN